MKTQPSSVRTLPEQTILSAWREQVTQAAQAPALRRQLLFGQHELLPRFAEQYQSLEALPRHVRRGLQRKWKQSLASVALLLALGQAPALAATINVGGGCLLVDAIAAANTDNAIGLCTAGSGTDTIVLPANSTRTLTTINNTSYGSTGLPVITSAMTIAGNNSTIARSQVTGTPEFRLLMVASTGDLILQGLTLTGGMASAPAFTNGGGIYSRGILAIQNSTITGNSARGGGGLYNNDGAVTLSNSTASGNTALTRGGGMDSEGGPLILNNSTVSNNTATDGGGVSNRGAMTLTSSTISGNTAGLDGGGVYNNSGRAFLTNSTISGNRAIKGAGLSNIRGPMSLTNSTVTGNRAGEKGGGVYNYRDEGTRLSRVLLTGSLISGNTATSGPEVFQAVGGVVTDNAFNLFGHSGLTNAQALGGFAPSIFSGTATADGNLPTALASILNPTLASNGGLTQTHALVANSPAIDAVPTGCPPPNTDQREVPRPQDGNNDGAARCDIGAFERVRTGTVTCDGLPATKIGTSASETLNGTAGPDVIQGLGGNDLIRGLAGNDVVCGGFGNDRLFGGANEDRLFGEVGTDRLDGELDFDRCDGGPPTADTTASCEQVSNVP